MSKRNGFTLVELLAVIAILAIILLIAVPQILGVIDDARKDSFRNSVRNVFHAAELKNARENVTSGTIASLDLSGTALTGNWAISTNASGKTIITLTNVTDQKFCVASLVDTDKGTTFAVTDGNCTSGS